MSQYNVNDDETDSVRDPFGFKRFDGQLQDGTPYSSRQRVSRPLETQTRTSRRSNTSMSRQDAASKTPSNRASLSNDNDVIQQQHQTPPATVKQNRKRQPKSRYSKANELWSKWEQQKLEMMQENENHSEQHQPQRVTMETVVSLEEEDELSRSSSIIGTRGIMEGRMEPTLTPGTRMTARPNAGPAIPPVAMTTRISPQDTVSLLEEDPADDLPPPRRLTMNDATTTIDVRKQLVQLNTSLESKLAASESARHEEEIRKTRQEVKRRGRELLEKEHELDETERALETQCMEFERHCKAIAIGNLLNKRWREDYESMSFAFAKWIRFGLMQPMEEEKHMQQQELLKSQEELESHRQELQELQNGIDQQRNQVEQEGKKLDATKRELEVQSRDLATKMAALDESKLQYQSEKRRREEELERRERALEDQQATLDKDSAVLSSLDKFLNGKQKELEQRQRLGAGRSGHVVSFMQSDSTERLLRAERKVNEQAAERLARREKQLEAQESALREADNALRESQTQFETQKQEYRDAEARLCEMTRQVSAKLVEVEEREKRVAFELQKCEEASAQVQSSALALREKEEELEQEKSSLALRFEECDACEMELQRWQRRLEENAADMLRRKGAGQQNGTSKSLT